MIMNDKERLLLHKKWTGQISIEEMSQLEALLSSDPGLRKEALALESIWDKAEPLASPEFVPDTVKAWARFKKEIDGGAPLASKPPRILTLVPSSLVGKVAAAIAFLVLSYFVVLQFQPDPQVAVADLITIDPHPTRVMGGFKLPDGSVVWINSNTTLQYPEEFYGGERRVILDGEAHFKVKRNRRKPFIVETPSGEVQVLGTAFNVNANPSGEYEDIYVESGVVAFNPDESTDKRKLRKGDFLRFEKSTQQFLSPPVAPTTALTWKLKALNFRNTPLKDILDALERNTPMRFYRKNVKDILHCPFTISLEGADEKTVVAYLKAVTGVEISLDVKSYVYYLSGGRKCD